MSSYEHIVRIARELAANRPAERLTYADIAAAAGVHWTTVRRHLGDKRNMVELLTEDAGTRDAERTKPETRQRILDSARHIFAEHGYAAANLDSIAAESGLTKGAVYWHFSSKQDLFFGLLQSELERMQALLPREARQLTDMTSHPTDAAARMLRSRFPAQGSDTGSAYLFFEFLTATRDSEVKQQLQAAYARIWELAEAQITQLQESGIIGSDVQPEELAIMIQSLIHGMMVSWIIDPDRIDFDRIVPGIARILWHGIGESGPGQGGGQA
ncbi:TetR family transcriptional regulator [Paenibacillus dendritiformis]|uniref:TetR family transcriptional regulator n=1 Tax=Paenibacillus dendritiformis TaxID=130049 RepID=UPI0010598FC5|nr:TetR family transcriptional regulator [Paenibacillus dendritiformis]TDL54035.1 TetR family transcriptional regulator [Paenibacillus dendritiformis]